MSRPAQVGWSLTDSGAAGFSYRLLWLLRAFSLNTADVFLFNL